jgi:site-specific recombinase XerD
MLSEAKSRKRSASGKLEYISRFLGHKSLETTQKYTHLAKDGEL